MKHIIDTDELVKLKRFNTNGTAFVYFEDLRKLIANSPQADGMVLVPIEPTDEMTDVADDVFHAIWKEQREYSMAKAGKEAYASYPFSVAIYKAMLSAYKPQAECKTSILSSRMCELGTKACVVEHKPKADDARKDTERLDWLQSQSVEGMGWVARNSSIGRGYRLHQDPSNVHGYSVREAIDKARE